MKTSEIASLLVNASSASRNAPRVNISGGCARVYVCIIGKDLSRKLKSACTMAGLTYQARCHYGAPRAIYIGYDNATGAEYARGVAFADYLSTHGIEAVCEAFGD